MTISAFVTQVTTMLALTPEDFATIEPRNGDPAKDYRVGHEKLGLFVFSRWCGTYHLGVTSVWVQQGSMTRPRDLVSTRRLSLRDGWHLRRQFEIWARRAVDLTLRQEASPQTNTLAPQAPSGASAVGMQAWQAQQMQHMQSAQPGLLGSIYQNDFNKHLRSMVNKLGLPSDLVRGDSGLPRPCDSADALRYAVERNHHKL